jgi:SPP1 gp7 family putative phage head morphogenesis protein
MRSLTLDARDKTLRGKFKPSPSAESAFYRQLRKVAQHSGHIVEIHRNGAFITDDAELQRQLRAYSEKLTPWATSQAARMLKTVSNSNKSAYTKKSKAIGTALKFGVAEKDVLETGLALLNEEVGLIKSIPLEAGLRAQRIAYEAVLEGNRAAVNEDTLAELIEQQKLSTQAATSRALLIARTEVARANASINRARAEAVGSGQYRWHNSGDAAVRPSHRKWKGSRLQGMIFSWDLPPTLDDGMTGHPGTFPNCRCFAEPIFLDE